MTTPLVFVSGGHLGDFIHQLSVVKEAYRVTGRKAVLYIFDRGGQRPFERGVYATYHDLCPLLGKEEYIEAFWMYGGQPYDHDLSDWIAPDIYERSWRNILSKYGYGWNTSPWVHVDPMPGYEEVTFISTSVRWNDRIDYADLVSQCTNPMFLAVVTDTYNDFFRRTGIELPVVLCPDLLTLARTLQGCRLFIGTLSMPLALADALGKNRIALLGDNLDSQIALRSDTRAICIPSDIPVMLKRCA